jgi:predicted transcriptional regulator YdeE
MQRSFTKLDAIKLVGISARTSNAKEFSGQGIIPQTIGKYHAEAIASKTQHRKTPGKLFCVYTNYESDMNGEYTYFVGEEVNSFDGVSGLDTLLIPAQDYKKFTNDPAPMPQACISMWQKILAMDKGALGGERSYIADFEVYDERAADQSNAVLDIYIGIK